MTILTSWRWLDKSNYELYISEIVEKITQEEEIPEELIEWVKEKLSFKNWLIWIDRLIPDLKEYINENFETNFDNIKNKITSLWILRMNETMEKNLENDIKTICEYLYNQSMNLRLNEWCTKLIKELIINITILEWYKKQQKNQKEIGEKINGITETTTTRITEVVE